MVPGKNWKGQISFRWDLGFGDLNSVVHGNSKQIISKISLNKMISEYIYIEY